MTLTRFLFKFFSLLLLLAAFFILSLRPGPALAAPKEGLMRANELFGQGNWNDAYALYREILLGEGESGEDPAPILNSSVQCLSNLQRFGEIDSLIEESVKKRPSDWKILHAASLQYTNINHQGYQLAGAFVRGWPRGGEAKYLNSVARDRVRSMQLVLDAIHVLEKAGERNEAANLYQELARTLLGGAAWKLQARTDLTKLPDFDEGYEYSYRRDFGSGAPVDENGDPVYYSVPESFEAAASDGERWRFCLHRIVELDPNRKDAIQYQLAQFLESQFGVRTLAQSYRYFSAGDDEKDGRSSIYSLKTLKDNETIARLANGIKRFVMPADFDFIGLLNALAVEKGGYQQNALEELARIFEDRQQYPQAVEYWKKAIEIGGPGANNYRQQRLDQIAGAWGQFEATEGQAAGNNGSFEYLFRNGTSVSFEAHRIDVEKLLEDMMEYLRSNPKQLDWESVEINNIGYRIVEKNQKKYLVEKTASWKVPLTPRENHFSKRITVEAPIKNAGAYLVTARIAGGNTTKAILWLNDTAVVRKQLDGSLLYFLADAKTGKPVQEMKLQFFGYQQKWSDRNLLGGRAMNIITTSSTGTTDSQGQFIAANGAFDTGYQWLMVAHGDSGRFAYLGFNGIWSQRYYDQEYNQRKVYGITDRPVYRPEQTVHYKIWVRHAKYDQEKDDVNPGSNVSLVITNPRGDKIVEKSVTLDAWGGYEESLELKKDVQLGVYNISIPSVGSAGTFRVEEYKKPEFEVTVDAPAEPVMLGEKISSTIKAKYYFGAPVSKAKVHFKVYRADTETSWYPIGIWDWFYGPGYWWFAYDYRWYPGWEIWGCRAPAPWWIWHGQQNPPELVQDREVDIGADGSFKIEIDTAIAKELHGDTDHRYSITAEVVDDSRRVITGTGSVLVTRKPFKVYAWVDRGYFRSGDTINAGFSAQTGDNKPVQGKGEVKLLALSYDKDGKPQERIAEKWEIDTNDQGSASLQIKAAQLGQYRLSYTVTDKAGHSIEGGYIFTVIGESFSGKNYRFNDIELIPDKKEYAPGDKVQLQINTEQAGSTVLLFLRPANGIYLAPELIRLEGKSTVKTFEIAKKDMPNFFVEAMTVHDGKVLSQMKEIVVPPEKRVLNIEVLPSEERYKPGQQASVKLKITDFFGKPFSGSAAISVYDKSVEYISGGSNVPEIKQFFWKWRRTHRSTVETNLMRIFAALVPPGETAMGKIGVFGGLEADSDNERQVDPVGKDELRRARSEKKMMSLDGGGSRLMDQSAAAPAAMGAMEGGAADELDDFKNDLSSAKQESAGGEDAAAVQPAIRKEFADTAFWNGNISVGDDGLASVSFKMPENLTTWKIRTWALGEGTRVGEGTSNVVTSKNLLLRLQAPRFFVEKDEVVLSANIHNYLSGKKSVQAKIELPGEYLKLLDDASKNVSVEPNGEVRVDWRVKVLREGDAVVRMLALSDEESDAMEMRFPVYVHGMLKTESFSGVVRPEQKEGSVSLKVPEERRPDQTRLEIRYSPTLAGAMVDALPYLVNFPYGCTEQTLNRFLPTVITQKVLRDIGVNLREIQEKRANLNAQEIGDDSERAKQWKRYDINPVFDEAAVKEMIQAGVDRLAAMQLSNGGWGWFSGWGETASAHITSGVVHGLQIARAAGVSIPPQMISRGVAFLKDSEAGELRELRNYATKTTPYREHASELDAFVHMVLVDEDSGDAAMREFLYRDRNKMAVYGKTLQALIFQQIGDKEKVQMLKTNIEQFLVQDDENQTAYLNLGNEGYWWYWYGSEFEAHAYYLKLLTRIDPQGPVAPKLVKYLLNNRKHATYWSSTRDTALIVEAFADYLKASGEMAPDIKLEILVDGISKRKVHITKENLFSFENKLVLAGNDLSSGGHKVLIRKEGKGPIYFNAYLTNFTLEDPIAKAGLEVKVERKYYKLVKDESATALSRGGRGQALSEKVEKYIRQELPSPAALKSGDLVQVELEIESKNDYEYLIFEDMKPAGFEPVEVRSGYNGNEMGAYVEFRDERVAFFVRALPRGKRSVSYRMRAEIPGTFSALPTRASAMYAPELKANSDELKATVEDK